MGSLLWRLSSLLSGVGLLVVGVGLLFSVLGLRVAANADFSSLALGLITSAYFVGFVAGTYVCPKIIRKVGHIRAFAAMASLASTMPILHALWADPWFWGVLRFVTGLCLVGLYIVVESWLNTVAPNEQRGKVFALYMTTNFVALAVGQWLILVDQSGGFLPFALVSIMFSFALLPITMTPVDQPQAVDAPRLSMRRLIRTSPIGVAAALVSGLVGGAFYGMGALFAQGVGLQDTEAATFMAAVILGGAAFQWPVGHFSDRHDRRWVLFFVCVAGAAVCVLMQALVKVSVSWLLPLGVVLGGLVFAIYGLGVAHTNDVVDSTRLVEYSGGLLLVHGAGAALGPTVAGGLMEWLGPSTLLLYFAGVLVPLALYALKRVTTVASVPDDEKAAFVVMGAGSQAVLHMDPRSLADEVLSANPAASDVEADVPSSSTGP